MERTDSREREFRTCPLREEMGGEPPMSTQQPWAPLQQGLSQELTELTQEIHKATCAQQELHDQKITLLEGYQETFYISSNHTRMGPFM